MSELKAYTEEELAEHQQLYDEVFTPVWESEGQYCRAGGGQYEKSFAWWAFKHQQSKVDELQKQKSLQELETNQIAHANQQWQLKCGGLQKRVDGLIKNLDEMGIKSWAVWESSAEMYEQGRADAYWGAKDLLEQALKGGCDANQ